MARILYLDLETFPQTARVWGTYQQDVLEVLEHTALACYSAKWADGRHITRALCDTEGYAPGSRDDKALVAELWALLDEADIVIAHYGSGFDVPVANARFAAHRLGPPSTYAQVDTKKQASRLFHFNANKLDHIADYLGIGHKLQTGGYDLWRRCMAGRPEAWRLMKRYNKQDVVLLEQVYLALRPWMDKHPRVNDGKMNCPKCGSDNLQSRGVARNTTRTYRRYQCLGCGGWLRDTKCSSSSSVTNAA